MTTKRDAAGARRRPLPHRVGTAVAAAVSVLLCLVLGAGSLAVPSRTAQAAPRPAAVVGAQTAGDSLFPDIGNGGYDVTHYAIDLRWASAGTIVASTTVTATAAAPLAQFSLDLEGLTVDSVTVNGSAADYSRHDHKLVVKPAQPVSGSFATVVAYHGTPHTHIDPDGSEDGWIGSAAGATVLSEPVGAMTWFPDNNTPRDKATYTVAVSVPSGLAVAGNGDLTSRVAHGSRTTWTWTQTSPMASYLAMVSIGKYRVYHTSLTTQSGRRLPVWSFVSTRYGSVASQRGQLPAIIRFLERRFGDYPFSSVGIVVADVPVSYSLETQNRPVFPHAPSTTLMVHELSHQWFGDAVTPQDWGDIWLNEGFADFAETAWRAAHGGPSKPKAYGSVYRKDGPSNALWSPAPAALGKAEALFSDPVYTRGGMTLEALRERVGTSAFYPLLQHWVSAHHGTSVRTAQFVALADRRTGRHLTSFFHSWLYVARKPASFP